MNTIRPSMVSSKQLKKFKEIYLRNFNIELSDEEATRQATDLLNLMKILLKPEPKEAK